MNDKWCVVANVHQQVLGAADQTTMTSQSTGREEAFHILIQLIINTDKSYTFIFVKARLSCHFWHIRNDDADRPSCRWR